MLKHSVSIRAPTRYAYGLIQHMNQHPYRDPPSSVSRGAGTLMAWRGLLPRKQPGWAVIGKGTSREQAYLDSKYIAAKQNREW